MKRFARAMVALLLIGMLAVACGGGEEAAEAEPTLDPNLPTVVPVFTRDSQAIAQAATRDAAPTQALPTQAPTEAPTEASTAQPTAEAATEPTVETAIGPTVEPTAEPPVEPAAAPTSEPTSAPTAAEAASDVITGVAAVDATEGVTSADEAAGASDTVTGMAAVDASDGATSPTEATTDTQTTSDTGSVAATTEDADQASEATAGQTLEVGMYSLYFDEPNNIESPPVWTVTAGGEVAVELDNYSLGLQHNWAIVDPNSDFDPSLPYVPPGDGSDADLFYFNPGLIDGATAEDEPVVETVSFTAPDVGEYLVICTVAGHYPSMQGRLEVTN